MICIPKNNIRTSIRKKDIFMLLCKLIFLISIVCDYRITDYDKPDVYSCDGLGGFSIYLSLMTEEGFLSEPY